MADEISIIVMNVDLECHLCYKKIRKVLCKLQDKYKIKSTSYDEKNNAVIISGPFDPDELCDKLEKEAGRKVIKDIEIKSLNKKANAVGGGGNNSKQDKPAKPPQEEKPKQKPKPETPAPEDEGKPKAKLNKPEKGAKRVSFDQLEPEQEPKQKETPKASMKADPIKLPPMEQMPAQFDMPNVASAAAMAQGMAMMPQMSTAVPSAWPAPSIPAGPVCCFRPSYETYYGTCRCCSCGKVVGWAQGPLGYYGGRPTHYHYSCEEDPNSCVVM